MSDEGSGIEHGQANGGWVSGGLVSGEVSGEVSGGLVSGEAGIDPERASGGRGGRAASESGGPHDRAQGRVPRRW